jgi:hypothetical protein
MDELEIIHAKILNQYAFTLSIVAIIHSIADFMVIKSPQFYIMGIAGLYIFFTTMFTRVRFMRFHSLIFCICLALFLLYYSYLNGFNNGVSLYYVTLLSSIPLAAYNPVDRFRFVPVIFIIVAVLFLLNNMLYFYQIAKDEYVVSIKLRFFIIMHTLLFIGINIYFIILKDRMILVQYSKIKRAEILISDLKRKITTLHTESSNINRPTIERVIKLAMDDDITFIPVFKSLFPYMYDKLQTINPQITSAEFKFCALLKLGFSTKDISIYDNITIRSVQTRKSRLRKSFNLSPETDLYNWIEEI